MSTMSQLGEFLANIQNQQDARTATLEERLAAIEAKEGCECAETITALEERLATLESKEGCECGSYDELLASYEERISALEGNTGGSTEPMTVSQALEEYNHLISISNRTGNNRFLFLSKNNHKVIWEGGSVRDINPPLNDFNAAYYLGVTEGTIVKVYTPDLQEIEIIADATVMHTLFHENMAISIAFGNIETKEVYCYSVDCDNMTISPCTDEAFIAQWGNSDALGL